MELKMKFGLRMKSVKQGREGWNLKMKARLRLNVCEARQRGRRRSVKQGRRGGL